MAKILFVDKEKEILNGFKRVLFKMRKEWDMQFVTSGKEALKRMEQESFSAVVTDINILGMSGIDLFQIVKEKQPEIARIIVSGNSDLKNLLSSVGTAHQYLVKPVDSTVLKNTLLRVMNLRNYLKDPKLIKVVNCIDSLPPQPERHMELLKAIPYASIKEIARIIEKDLAMTVKIMQLANSPFLGIKSYVEDVYQAVMLIGVDILRALVLALEIFSKFKLSGIANHELSVIFNHSHQVANYARIVAMEITHDKRIANDSYMSGMVHDVGKLIILSKFQDDYFLIKKQLNKTDRMSFKVERELLGVDHSQLGAYLLGLWGLPEFLVETTAFHHYPGKYFSKEFSTVAAVHIANIIKKYEDIIPDSKLSPDFAIDYLRKINPNLLDRFPAIIAKISELREISLH